MSILATRRWKEDRLSEREPWSASCSFDVTGTTDARLAMQSVPFQLNTPLQPGSRLLCAGPSIEGHPSSEHYIVRCDFRIPTTGEFAQPEDDPLNDPIEVAWGPVDQELPVDTDLSETVNILIGNSAGDLKDGETRPTSHLSLMVKKNYPYYNLDWFATWSNRVNSAPVTIGGITFAAQHLYCRYPMPAAPYRINDPYVPVIWHFECVPNGLLGDYPFQHKFADQGTQGWYVDPKDSVTKPGPFTVRVGENWEPRTEPVRLDGTGKPIASLYPGVKVADGHDPVSPPTPRPAWQQTETPDAVWRYYCRVRPADFNRIPL